MISFRTRGNFIDFVLIEDTSLQNEYVLLSLHNTSKAVDWSFDENPLTITFSINEVQYSNIPISTIDFDGTTLTTQAGFETNIESMFQNLAGGEGGGGSFLSATVTLTDAQIKALPSGNVEVIAAPGIGKYLLPITVAFSLNNVAGAYTNVTISNPPQLWYKTSETGIVSSTLDDFAFTTPDKYGTRLILYSGNTGYGSSDIENKAIELNMGNGGSGNLTGGNAANTLKVTVYYVVVDL